MEGKKSKKLILLDGNALMHRAFHAFPTLTTKEGELVNAVYGFTSILLQLINNHDPDYVICTFDLPAKTFRADKFAEYKAHRVKMDGDLSSQFKRAREVLDSMNIPIYTKEGYEADDVIGTLARKALSKGINVEVITGDKDMLQLIEDNIKIITPGKQFTITKDYDYKIFVEEYGFEPKFLIDYKGLRGDSSDNIPGVKGIGEKSAKLLIEKFHTLENIYDHLDEVEAKYRSKLESEKDTAFLSKELSTIITDVDIDIDLRPFEDLNYENVYSLFKQLEFRSLLSRIPQYSKEVLKLNSDYLLVEDEEKIDILIDALKLSNIISISLFCSDNENFMEAKIKFVSLCTKDKKVFILNWNKLFEKGILNKIIHIFNSPSYLKVGYDLKWAFHAFFNSSVDLKGIFFDTLLAQYVLNPGERIRSLKDQVFEFLDVSIPDYDEISNKGKVNIEEININSVYELLASQSLGIYNLYELMDMKIDGRVKNIFENIELPLIEVLAVMENNGILIDTDLLNKNEDFFQQKLSQIQKEIYDLIGHEFNISSPKQLSSVLFDELKLPVHRKNKTGISTDDKTLSTLNGTHPVIQKIKEYREVSKICSTYIVSLKKLIYKDSRLHTSFNQAVTSTGRLSSANPNLQNIPIRTELGRRVRNVFIASSNATLLSLDYSQIELRLLAHYSMDPVLVNAFKQKQDIHALTASEIFNIPIEKVSPDQRRMAKIINFGIAYGMSEFGMSDQLGISRQEAKMFIDRYFDKYKNVESYINLILEKAKEDGYVETMMGRKRNIHGINDKNWHIREQARREAINMPLQGSNADMIKVAMIGIDKILSSLPVKVMMILQVHDELLFEVHTKENNVIKSIAETLINKMLEDVDLNVPIVIEAKKGSNWDQMEYVYSNI